MAHGRRALGTRLALVAAAVLSLAWALAAILAVDPGADQPTTYAAAFTAARFADVAAGLGLVAAGAFALTQPQARRLGLLAMLAGIAWLGADWEGADGPALLQSLGAVTAPFTIALVLHLAVALPTGRVRSPSRPGRSSLLRTPSPRQSAQATRSSAIRCSTSIAGAAATTTCSWSMRTRASQARSPTSGFGGARARACPARGRCTSARSRPPGPQGGSCSRCSDLRCSWAPPKPPTRSRCFARRSRIPSAPASPRSSSRARSGSRRSRSASPGASSGSREPGRVSPGWRASWARRRRPGSCARRS